MASGRPGFGLVVLASVLVLLSRPAAAQTDDAPPHPAERRVAIGGDVALLLAPPDDRTYFNYTTYDIDGLRMAQVQLYGEWHLHERLSLVGELRTQNAVTLEASALYARWRPFARSSLVIQAGRIPPVVGAFARRAYSRDNAVLGMPLAYQYLTLLRPDALPASTSDVLKMRGRGWQPAYPIGNLALAPGVPLVAGSRWDTGVEGSWTSRWLDLSAAVTQGAPAVPVIRESNRDLMWSGRAAGHLPGGITVGVSGARAGWLADSVLDLTTDGRQTPHAQTLVGVDTEFGVGRWLVRAEWLRSRFDLPIVDDADPFHRLTAHGGFIEGRYRFHPRMQVGVRVDRLAFGRLFDRLTGTSPTWDADVTRVEATFGVRLSRTLEVRAGWQENRRQSDRAARRGLPIAGLLYWF
ncbi:MAG: hypothetical protein ABI634_18045 [Acidobacteriota bacterium]